MLPRSPLGSAAGLLFVIALIIYSVSLREDYLQDWDFSRLSFVSGERYCSRLDIDNGHWANATRFSNYSEIPEVYGYTSWKHNYCGVNGASWHLGVTSGKPIEEEVQRKFDVAMPVFVKPNGCIWRDAAIRAKVILLLRMPAGAFMIGDSISLQLIRGHENLWEGWGPVRSHMDDGKNVWFPLTRYLDLDPEHPETADLLAEAGVSTERLKYPLMTWYRTWHILWFETMQIAFEGVPNYALTDHDLAYGFMDWFNLVQRSITESRTSVKWSVGIKEEPTVFLFHAGPHFVAGEVGEVGDEGLVIGFQRMVDIVEDMMRDLDFPLYLYFQTAIPGHVDCALSETFDNTRTDGRSPAAPEKKLYNYHLFPLFNDYLRSRFPDDRPRPYPETGQRNPTFRLLDTWAMSVKRPDAHRGPPNDCLHFCNTGVVDEWIKYWWHLMLEESANPVTRYVNA